MEEEPTPRIIQWLAMNIIWGLMYFGIHVWVLAPNWHLMNRKNAVHWLNETLIYDNTTNTFYCSFEDASVMFWMTSLAAKGSIAIGTLLGVISGIGLLWAIEPGIVCIFTCCYTTFNLHAKLRNERAKNAELKKELELQRSMQKEISDISIQ